MAAQDRVVARDAAAARRGVEVGMPRGRVRILFPEATVVVRDTALEAAAWEALVQEVHRGTPFIEAAPLGGARTGTGTGLRIGLETARLFFSNLEEAELVALLRTHGLCAGLAEDRETARLAALRAASGRLLRITAAQRTAFLAAFPIALLRTDGFSEELVEHLGLYGYAGLSGVARLTQRQLTLQFGDEGMRLYRRLHPNVEARRRVGRFRPPPVITAHADLETGASELHELLPVIEHLARRVARDLGAVPGTEVDSGEVGRGPKGRGGGALLASRLRLDLGAPGTPGHASAVRILPVPTRDARRLAQAARTLLHGALQEVMQRAGGQATQEDDPPRLDVMEVTLEAGALTEAPHQQLDLFSRPGVLEAIHRVERRYPGALRRVVLRPHALFEEDAFILAPAI